MASHTPGPWAHSQSGWVVRAPGGRPIASISPQARDEGNARLIAAAPEMLQALEAFAAGEPVAPEMARTAIVKARGL